MESLNADALRRLYVEELKTDQEIATLFGTYQVRISRLRSEFGIPTIAKADRYRLELSLLQKSVLIGSMLGDGRLFSTGSHTAAYDEHHCLKQKPYLDWKVQVFGEHVSRVVPSNKGDLLGYRFTTHGCRVLRPYWEMFYPSGCGLKTFVNLSVESVDSLAVAVWFMDDGSKGRGFLRFSVGSRPEDVKKQSDILRRFGVRCHIYKERGGHSLVISDSAYMKTFVDLIDPYLHPTMRYKVDLGRSLRIPPRHVLTPEVLKACSGMTSAAIAKKLGVSRQSVVRARCKKTPDGLYVEDPSHP